MTKKRRATKRVEPDAQRRIDVLLIAIRVALTVVNIFLHR